MPSANSEYATQHYGFLLLPNYSSIAFSSAVESLRLANREFGRTIYDWKILTLDGTPTPASCGMQVIPDGKLDEQKQLDTLMVCGGLYIEENWSRPLELSLKKLAREKINLGALCTGAYLLAKAGLLDGYRATIHWENMASVREEFPRVNFTSDLFEVDRDRYTCAGGTSPIDMMLNIIREQQGADLACKISEVLICDRMRGHNDRQRTPLRMHLGTSQPKLTEAVTLMEANLEEPMSLDELSGYVGISRRQLERLFKKYLNCVPTRYYLELRLTRARQLLLQTNKSIVDVALACGFISSPHFSKCYRDYFGIPPRDERRLHQAGKVQPATGVGLS
ncbi:MAG: GlxA family transcriptional regulator [Gammaproteobacteria bacterium]|nr:GlxA family transcriptional regulator [Gammaproteobacteria bacterium]